MKDDGHLMGVTVLNTDSVTVEATFSLEPAHQFDQAGLMVRVDKDHWLKTGVWVRVSALSLCVSLRVSVPLYLSPTRSLSLVCVCVWVHVCARA